MCHGFIPFPGATLRETPFIYPKFQSLGDLCSCRKRWGKGMESWNMGPNEVGRVRRIPATQIDMGRSLPFEEELKSRKFLDRNTMLGTNMLAGPDDSGFQSLQNLATKHEKDDLCKRPS
jgi:hypothetical protein